MIQPITPPSAPNTIPPFRGRASEVPLVRWHQGDAERVIPAPPVPLSPHPPQAPSAIGPRSPRSRAGLLGSVFVLLGVAIAAVFMVFFLLIEEPRRHE